MFWVLITLSLVCADKLDRTYLPPPWTEYSGGRPEDIQIPLEHPRLEYPTSNDFIDNAKITVGIDRVGPNQISDEQKELMNTSPAIDNIITTPNYSYSESPIIQNIYKDRDQNQNNNRLPANRIIDSPNYTSQFETDTKPLFPTTVQAQAIEGVNNVFYVPCNRSLPLDSINNSCEINNNGKQYFSTLSPTTYPSTTSSPSPVTSKFSDYSNPSRFPNFNYTATSPFYSSTTKSAPNKNSLNFAVTAKLPERIQAQADREAVIINYENLWTPEGYAYSFDTSNGIHGDESGIALNGVRAKGSYSYIGDDGKRYSVVYTADENGFQPHGDHLPTPPPIPDAILKVIEKAFEEKKAGIFDDGSYDENKYGYKKYQTKTYEQSFFNHRRGQEKKEDRLNSRNNIPLEPIRTDESESLRKLSASNYSKNMLELNQNIKEMKDIKEKFFKELPVQSNNATFDKINSSLITKLTSFTEMDHQYSKQNEETKEFPARFSEMQDVSNENMQQVKVTPKPFMTPYASRKSNEDDEIDMSDSNEKIFQKSGQFFNDGLQQNLNNAELKYQEEDNLKKQVTFPDISGNSDSFKLANNGYFYPKVMDSEETFFDQHANPYLTVLSNGPFEFSTRSTIPNFNQYYSGTQTTPAPSSPAIKEKEIDNLTPTSFPNYSTTKLDLVNDYGNTNTPINNNFNNDYGSNNENVINTSEIVSTSRPDVPKFKASYSPNINLMISNYNTIPPTETNIEEDFSGPKRPHSFDPLTGYHY